MLKRIVDRNTWKEVFATLRSNKKRTITTAMGVFWGVFLLIILHCVGSGIENAFVRQLSSVNKNSLLIFPQQRTIPCEGFPKGSYWSLTGKDTRLLKNENPEATRIGEVLFAYGGWGANSFTYQGNSAKANNFLGVTPDYFLIQKLIFTEGRPLNTLDEVQSRTTCVIGEKLKNQLFGRESAEGKIIENNGTYYTVVGVMKQFSNNLNFFGNAANMVIIPCSRMRARLGVGDNIDGMLIELNLPKGEKIDKTKNRIVESIKARHSVAAEDQGALSTFDIGALFSAVSYMLLGIMLLIWIIGIGTLMGAIISVSNIMLITVRERRREIGIRRAIGAKPRDIRLQITLESLTITLLSGLAGMVFALLIMIGVNEAISGSETTEWFYQPLIPFDIAILCVVIIGLSGILASLLPASNALRIKAVEALQEE